MRGMHIHTWIVLKCDTKASEREQRIEDERVYFVQFCQYYYKYHI